MARPKDIDRPRSARLPMTEEEYTRLHTLAGDVPIVTYLRRLLEREWAARKSKGGKP
jgi:hypothetical protein